MRLSIALLAGLLAPLAAPAQPVPMLDARLTSEPRASGALFGIAVASSADRVLVGASGENGSRGAAYVFTRSGMTWTPEARLVAPARAASDAFGRSVALDGDRALVGAPGENGARGAAYVFVRAGSAWAVEARLDAPDGQAPDEFGFAVGLSGERAVVGAPTAGAAYAFVRTDAGWTFEARLADANGAPDDGLGAAVAMAGDRVLVGAPRASSRAGAAYVYARTNGAWALDVRLVASDAMPGVGFGDFFGYAVALSGETALVGAYARNSFRGAAYVFARSSTGWAEQARLTPATVQTSDFFGDAVALSGETALVGASGTLAARGAAYLFDRVDEAWVQRARLTDPEADILDVFGIAVALDGDRAVVSARGDDDRRGAVVVYTGAGFVSAEGEAPSGVRLSAPVPNPAAGRTTLALTVERAQRVRAVMYDALGREVLVAFDGAIADAARIEVATDALPAGVYVVRVTGETFVRTQRVTVAR